MNSKDSIPSPFMTEDVKKQAGEYRDLEALMQKFEADAMFVIVRRKNDYQAYSKNICPEHDFGEIISYIETIKEEHHEDTSHK